MTGELMVILRVND